MSESNRNQFRGACDISGMKKLELPRKKYSEVIAAQHYERQKILRGCVADTNNNVSSQGIRKPIFGAVGDNRPEISSSSRLAIANSSTNLELLASTSIFNSGRSPSPLEYPQSTSYSRAATAKTYLPLEYRQSTPDSYSNSYSPMDSKLNNKASVVHVPYYYHKLARVVVPPNSPVENEESRNQQTESTIESVAKRLYDLQTRERDAREGSNVLAHQLRKYNIPDSVPPHLRYLRKESIQLDFNKILYNLLRAKRSVVEPTWEMALLMRSAIIRKFNRYHTKDIVHIHGVFFADPARRYGFCLFCIGYTPLHWKLVKVHAVAHISKVASVRCEKCGRGICRFRPAADCLDCIFVYFPNKPTIDAGEIFQSA